MDKNEWNKMVSGQKYIAYDKYLLDRLMVTREKIYTFNNLPPTELNAQQHIIRELFGSVGHQFHINQPFRCDYGCNIHVGERFFANFNLTILDEGKVRIGDDVMIGPNVSIYTACHPLDEQERNSLIEWAEPVVIGNSVWIGGNAVILPGVTIGNNVVIGAGSVVTKDIPDNEVVAGNPAKIIKHLQP